jgi:hypothetical protein
MATSLISGVRGPGESHARRQKSCWMHQPLGLSDEEAPDRKARQRHDDGPRDRRRSCPPEGTAAADAVRQRLRRVRVGKDSSTWSEVPGQTGIVRGPRDRVEVFVKKPMMSSGSPGRRLRPGRAARTGAGGPGPAAWLPPPLTIFWSWQGVWLAAGRGNFQVTAPPSRSSLSGGAGTPPLTLLFHLLRNMPSSYCANPK